MTVSVGARFGVYEVIAPLGSVGMGNVSRAIPRLDRTAEVKILGRGESDYSLLVAMWLPISCLGLVASAAFTESE